MGRAGPLPAPFPGPSSTDPLHHPSLISTSTPSSLSSDLSSGPDLAAAESSAGLSSSVQALSLQAPRQLASAPPSSSSLAVVRAPDLDATGSSTGIFSSVQPLSIFPAVRASDLAAAGPVHAAAGSSAGLLSSDQPLSLQPSRQQTPSSSRSGSIAAVNPFLAAAGSSAGLLSSDQVLSCQRAPSSISSSSHDALPSRSEPSLFSSCPLSVQQIQLQPALQQLAAPAAQFSAAQSVAVPQLASVLPLLSSVLQPTATSSAIPPSSSLPPPSQTASLQPSLLGTSMECSKVSLDTPHFSATAQNPTPIGSTPSVRFNASTKKISANPHSLSAAPLPSSDPFPPLPHSQPSPPPQHLPLPLPPPSSLSYAQTARQPRGSGFVRSHAADVESFARLPRTGANIICGSKEGIPSFSFVHSDLQTVENLYSNALIMKFHGGRPSLEVSHREIQSWGLEHSFSIGPLSSRAFLLRFQDNQDLIRVLTRPSSILITSPYKIFRWHNLCHLKDDSCYAPVWISLPRLPLQCFIPEFLESVANRIGRFLCFDKATTTLARPSAARLCVELDLRITPPPFIWVGLFDGLKQPILYEKLPKFCGECHIQGHLATTCPKGQRETPNFQAFPRPMMNWARPPHARQNAVKQVSAPLHQPNTLAAPSSISQPPKPPNHPSTSAPSPSPLLNAEVPRQQPLAAAHTSVPSPSLLLAAEEARHHHTPLHQPTYLQVQPTVSPLQRAPDAATSSDYHLQAQLTAALLQQVPQAPPSTGLLQQAAAAAGAAVHDQSSDTLLQRDPAAAAPSADLEPLRQSSPLLQRASVSAAPSAAPSANLDPPLQSASPVQRVSVSAAPSLHPANPSVFSAHSSGLIASTMTHPPPPHKSSTLHKGKHKSIKTKPPDVGTSSSLNQQQQEALELFKSKVLRQSRIQDLQPSVNHFEALRYDHSDADGEDALYYSDTDDGCVEPIELGYQSANGRSSNKHKDFALSGKRTNKRHPNMPLRVKLRSRKDSHPSTP